MFLYTPVCQLVIEVLGCIGKSREDNDLAVTGVERGVQLAFDLLLEQGQFLVALRGYILGGIDQLD